MFWSRKKFDVKVLETSIKAKEAKIALLESGLARAAFSHLETLRNNQQLQVAVKGRDGDVQALRQQLNNRDEELKTLRELREGDREIIRQLREEVEAQKQCIITLNSLRIKLTNKLHKVAKWATAGRLELKNRVELGFKQLGRILDDETSENSSQEETDRGPRPVCSCSPTDGTNRKSEQRNHCSENQGSRLRD